MGPAMEKGKACWRATELPHGVAKNCRGARLGVAAARCRQAIALATLRGARLRAAAAHCRQAAAPAALQ
ncbi:hypothetical protein GUJ93_ZPchr0006g42659 [Zizania palustris]|uniref:Uncharacterized protein n=1 Tax=Zizania palustris TaxID=103762 RepID=A0A8J5SN51_ZIZPA|nr:hypothetical protein GUJ93_ZPchr0006g42659 [Zizania palustris]